MPPGVLRFEAEARYDLLARLHGTGDALAALELRVAAVHVPAELGVDEVAAVPEQPVHAVVVGARFLAGGEGEDDVTVGHQAIPLHLDERRDEDRRAVLHVARPSSIEEAVLLGERVRVDAPVGATGGDDVEVGEEEDRLPPAGAADSRHEVVVARSRRPTTWTSAAGMPAAIRRRAIAWAATVVLPESWSVLVPIRSRNTARAVACTGESPVACAAAGGAPLTMAAASAASARYIRLRVVGIRHGARLEMLVEVAREQVVQVQARVPALEDAVRAVRVLHHRERLVPPRRAR